MLMRTAGFSVLLIIIFLAVYFFSCYLLYRIGRKFKIGSFAAYCIPIHNLLLLCDCGGISRWNVLGSFIPIVQIYCTINIWGSIAQKLGKNYWIYGITTLLFGIPVFILAFDSSMPAGHDRVAENVIAEKQTDNEVGESAMPQDALQDSHPEQIEGEPVVKEKKAKTKKIKIPSMKKPSFLSDFSMQQINEMAGVDIGTTSIKVCTLKNVKNVFVLQNIIKKTYEHDLLIDGHIVDLDFVAQELKQIFSDNQIKTKDVACALSSYSVITKKISMPFLEEDALDKTINAEVENVIPFPLRDIYYSYYVMGVDPEKENSMNVQIVAAKKEIVDGYMAVFNMAGLNLQILDVDIFSVTNLIEQVYNPKEFSVVAVDIGASVTNIAILKGENIEFTREILMGGKYLTNQIEKTTKLPFKEAEEKKIIGDSEVLYLFEDFIFNIASEINKTVKFYLATKPKETIEKIYITGGSSLVQGLKEKIMEDTGVAVEVINPFIILKEDESKIHMYEELKEFMAVPLYLSTRVTDIT